MSIITCSSCNETKELTELFVCEKCKKYICQKNCGKDGTIVQNGLFFQGFCLKCANKMDQCLIFYNQKHIILDNPFEFVPKKDDQKLLKDALEKFKLVHIVMNGKLMSIEGNNNDDFQGNESNLLSVTFTDICETTDEEKKKNKQTILMQFGLSGDGGWHNCSTYLQITINDKYNLLSNSRSQNKGYFSEEGNKDNITFIPNELYKNVSVIGKTIVSQFITIVESYLSEETKKLYKIKTDESDERKKKRKTEGIKITKKSRYADDSNDSYEEDEDEGTHLDCSQTNVLRRIKNLLYSFRDYGFKEQY